MRRLVLKRAKIRKIRRDVGHTVWLAIGVRNLWLHLHPPISHRLNENARPTLRIGTLSVNMQGGAVGQAAAEHFPDDTTASGGGGLGADAAGLASSEVCCVTV